MCGVSLGQDRGILGCGVDVDRRTRCMASELETLSLSILMVLSVLRRVRIQPRRG